MIHRLYAACAILLIFVAAVAATRWSLQPQQSALEFVGTQAGAPFTGAFDRFTADIAFDPAELAASRFDVRIDMTSVNTQDSERDEILRGPDLFHATKWPTAHYVAEKFTDKGGGKYAATGQLTMRDVTRPVPIEFTFEQDQGQAWLKGQASLQRLDFGVGQGDWRDTETVADKVQIRFALLLTQ